MNRSYLKIKEKFFQNKNNRLLLNMETVKKDHFFVNKEDEFSNNTIDNINDVDNINNVDIFDNQLLNRLFDLFDDGSHKIYTIYICIFVSGKFLMEKSDTGFSLPQFSYQCPELQGNGKNDDEFEYSPENIHFSNSCIQYAVDILNLEIHSDNDDLAIISKGFLPYDENTLFTFFDFTNIFLHKKEKKWFATIDDIIVNKTINRIPIDPIIIDFFIKNKKIIE